MINREKLPTGRPNHEADEMRQRVVVGLASSGVSQDEIAATLGISAKTLRKHYGPELGCGKAEANAAVRGRLFQKAMEGDTTALIFWAKTQMGWREAKDQFDEPPATLEVQYKAITPRELARKVAYVLAKAHYGPYNKSDAET